MSNDHVREQVAAIIKDEKTYPFPKNMAMAATWVLGNLKGLTSKFMMFQRSARLEIIMSWRRRQTSDKLMRWR